jgi:hypothetical protein
MPGVNPLPWTVQAFVIGGATSIVLPASPGISWVLQSFTFKLADNAVAAAEGISILDGATVVWSSQLFCPSVQVPDEETQTVTIIGTPGNSMTLTFSSFGANTFEEIVASGIVQ